VEVRVDDTPCGRVLYKRGITFRDLLPSIKEQLVGRPIVRDQSLEFYHDGLYLSVIIRDIKCHHEIHGKLTYHDGKLPPASMCVHSGVVGAATEITDQPIFQHNPRWKTELMGRFITPSRGGRFPIHSWNGSRGGNVMARDHYTHDLNPWNGSRGDNTNTRVRYTYHLKPRSDPNAPKAWSVTRTYY